MILKPTFLANIQTGYAEARTFANACLPSFVDALPILDNFDNIEDVMVRKMALTIGENDTATARKVVRNFHMGWMALAPAVTISGRISV